MSEQRLRSASNSKLPMASEIPDPDMFREAVSLLKKGTKLRTEISEREEELSKVRDRLGAIAVAYDMPGFRHGLHSFEYRGWQTRSSLSKEKLLSLGVTAETIDAAYVGSKPFLDMRISPFDIE